MTIIMSKDVIKVHLRNVPLFADLTVDALDALASAGRAVMFKRKTRMFEEGSPADCCFVLTSGRARIVLSGANGTEILRNIVGTHELVGEVALLEKSARTASFVARRRLPPHSNSRNCPGSAPQKLAIRKQSRGGARRDAASGRGSGSYRYDVSMCGPRCLVSGAYRGASGTTRWAMDSDSANVSRGVGGDDRVHWRNGDSRTSRARRKQTPPAAGSSNHSNRCRQDAARPSDGIDRADGCREVTSRDVIDVGDSSWQ